MRTLAFDLYRHEALIRLDRVPDDVIEAVVDDIDVPEPMLDTDALRQQVPDLGARVAYVSGCPGMVDATRKVLRGAGVRRVRTDAFSGY